MFNSVISKMPTFYLVNRTRQELICVGDDCKPLYANSAYNSFFNYVYYGMYMSEKFKWRGNDDIRFIKEKFVIGNYNNYKLHKHIHVSHVKNHFPLKTSEEKKIEALKEDIEALKEALKEDMKALKKALKEDMEALKEALKEDIGSIVENKKIRQSTIKNYLKLYIDGLKES